MQSFFLYFIFSAFSICRSQRAFFRGDPNNPLRTSLPLGFGFYRREECSKVIVTQNAEDNAPMSFTRAQRGSSGVAPKIFRRIAKNGTLPLFSRHTCLGYVLFVRSTFSAHFRVNIADADRIPVVILGNKEDETFGRCVSTDAGMKWSRIRGNMPFFEVTVRERSSLCV